MDRLIKEIRDVNRRNGWNLVEKEDWNGKNVHKIPAIIALIHSEASEALEEFRKDDIDNFLEEMADVVIRVFDCVGGLTDDFESVVNEKIERNRVRGFRHGGKRV